MMDRLGMKGLCAASIALALSVPVVPAHAAAADAAKFNVSSMQAGGSYDRFIVRYRDGSTEQVNRAAVVQNAGAAVARAGVSQATPATRQPGVSYLRKLATGSDLVITSRKLSQAEATAFIQSLAADPAVVYVAPDMLRQAVGSIPAPVALAPSSFTPNDGYFAKYQTDYLPGDGTATPANGVRNYGGANVTGAWNLADGTGATIAVLDTGIVKHADINTSLGDAGYDFITDAFVSGRATNGRVPGGWDLGDWTKGSPYEQNTSCVSLANPARNSSWHGTHVASAAGAEITNNGLGMAGIAYNAKVVPVRVLGHCGGYDSDITDAIVWAAGGHVDGVPDNPNPAQVLNLSLGGTGTCPSGDPAALAIAKANALGATVVVAAGNAGVDVANTWPASCPGAVAVAAVGVTSRLTWYSNYNGRGESIVAVGAFGGGVYPDDASFGLQQLNPEGFAWQAVNNGTTTPVASPGGDAYLGMAGTSQAAPHVAGTVALMQSARLAAGLALLSPAEVKNILQGTARMPNVSPDPAKTFGAGILDAGAAVAAAATGGSSDNTTALRNGVLLTGRSGPAGSMAVYKLAVPAGALALNLRTLGGTGDVSIYVKAGSAGGVGDYDYKSVHAGSNAESVAIARPVATTYYLTVVGESTYTGLSVIGSYSVPK